jgi:DNA modification methylase
MAIETNLIYCGDNLEVLAKFPEKSVDLIYADPPFFSNKHYEIIWGNGAEMKVYEDRWKGGINVYIEWMKERLWQCYRVLKDNGSMYLHCDWHATHRLRVAMEEVFGEDNFLREIIWDIGTSSGFKSQANLWIRGHDTILMFKKGKSYTFNKQYLGLAEKTIQRYDKTDDQGRKYKIYYDRNGNQRIVYADTSKGRPMTVKYKRGWFVRSHLAPYFLEGYKANAIMGS